MDVNNYNNGDQPQHQPPQEGNGMSIASMVLGIVAVVLSCIWYIGLPCAIVGLVLGINARKKNPNGMAKAGIILSIVSFVPAILFIVFSAVLVSSLGAAGLLS